MGDLRAYVDQYFPVLVASGFVWILLVGIASAAFRRLKGRTIITKAPANSLFVERWTSGRSLRNIITRLGGARNCLLVAVTDKALIVQPQLPFNLMFLPEIHGLDWTIPRENILLIEAKSGVFHESIVVEFTSWSGDADRVALRLRDPKRFQAALTK